MKQIVLLAPHFFQNALPYDTISRMNRGVVIFSPEELVYLSNVLNNSETAPANLLSKLQPTSSPEDSKVEMSAEDAEVILDTLPVPHLNQEPLALSCRDKLNDFLETFRRSNS